MKDTTSTVMMMGEYWSSRVRAYAFFGVKTFGGFKGCDGKVRVDRLSDRVIVQSCNMRVEIPMRDSMWVKFGMGKTWEQKVIEAQDAAFRSCYMHHRDEEMADHAVERLIRA